MALTPGVSIAGGPASFVVGGGTTTTLTSSPNPSVGGQSVTFTATVAASGSGVPTGTVTFTDGSTSLGAGTLSGGIATFSTSALTAGTHSITATYSGDANFAGSTSVLLSQTVNKANTATTLTSSMNPSAIGQSVTFTAAVTATAGTGTPTGTVTFYLNGTTPIGGAVPVSGGIASTNTTALPQGSDSITASYSGDTNYNSSNSAPLTQVVKANTITALTSVPNPSVVGQSVTFNATVTVAGGIGSSPTGGSVTFFDGTTTLGTGTLNGQGLASLSTSALTLGSHTITAVYNGDTNDVSSTSSPLTQVVNKPATTTTLHVLPTNTSFYGQSISFTATVTANAPATGTPTGTVVFSDGGTTLASQPLSNGSSTFNISTLSVGTHVINVFYNGDANFATSFGSPILQTVTKANSTTTLSSSANPSLVGQSVTFTATVLPVSPASGQVTGTVTFTLDGTTTLGTAPLTGTTASVNTASAGVTISTGSHTITAKYNGDTNTIGSNSSPLSQIVKANTTTALTVSPSQSVVGQSVTFTATVTPVAPGSGTPTGTVTFLIDGTSTLGTQALTNRIAAINTRTLGGGSHHHGKLQRRFQL
jgi:hypothetical protein